MLTTTYTDLLNFRCSSLECRSGYNVQAHHILKKRLGGPNEAWNYIALCAKCHKKAEKHASSIKLFVWKASTEFKLYGFTFDERDSKDAPKLSALLDRRNLPNTTNLSHNALCSEKEVKPKAGAGEVHDLCDSPTLANERTQEAGGRGKKTKKTRGDGDSFGKARTRMENLSGMTLEDAANYLQIPRLELRGAICILGMRVSEGRSSSNRMARLLTHSQLEELRRKFKCQKPTF